MKQALLNDQLTLAAPDAPATAICLDCGGLVKLRSRQGTYFWRHVRLPPGSCHPSNHGSVATDEGDATTDDGEHWICQVGDFIIEPHLDAPERSHLKLHSQSAEETRDGDPLGLTINLEDVRPLAAALLDAAEELTAAEALRRE